MRLTSLRESGPVLIFCGQRSARHVAHDQVGLARFFPEIIDWDDGGIFQRGHGLGFAFEAGPKGGIWVRLAGSSLMATSRLT